MIRRNVLFALFAMNAAIASYAQEIVPLDRVMTKDEERAMGLDKMSDKQRMAMEHWLADWTHKVIDQSPTYRPGRSLTDWILNWPSYESAKNRKDTAKQDKARQVANMIVDKIRINGEFVDLKDGSSWRIAPIYQYLSIQWRKGDRIEITPSENDLWPYNLHNNRLEQDAQAKQMKPPSPTGEEPPEEESYFEGSETILHIRGSGQFLELQNGTIWKIAPLDMMKVQGWHPNDRVRLEKSDNYLYRYTIHNLDNGQRALVNPSTLSEEKETLG